MAEKPQKAWELVASDTARNGAEMEAGVRQGRRIKERLESLSEKQLELPFPCQL